MATAQEYAAWIVQNEHKQGTPEFDTVATAYKLAKSQAATPEAVKPASMLEMFGKEVRDSVPVSLAAGLGAGAGRVAMGAQELAGRGLSAVGGLAAPAQTLSGLVTGQRPQNIVQRAGGWLEQDAQAGRDRLAGELAPYKASAPIATGVGALAGEIIPTLPVGGLIARGIAAIPGAAARIPNLLNAIRSSGMVAGEGGNALAQLAQLGTRALGGGITGLASAALVDPNSAGTGAIIGGGLPVLTKSAGVAGQWLGSTQAGQVVMNAFKSAGEKGARAAIRALGMEGREAELLGYLRSGADEIVPGSKPTVAQALVGTPAENAAGVYERVVSKSPGGNRLLDTYSAQGAARKDALEAVAPTNVLGLQQAKEDLGTTIANVYRPQEAAIKENAGKMFRSIDNPANPIKVTVPMGAIEQQIDKYLGAGTFGQGEKARQGAKALEGIATEQVPVTSTKVVRSAGGAAKWVPETTTSMTAAPKAASWEELQNVRTSLADAIDATIAKPGKTKEAAALTGIKAKLDEAIAASQNGKGLAGDNFPKEAAAQLQEARASWQAYKQQFHEGPQSALFKIRDGQPLRQGGEIPGLFWGGRPGLADDVRAFRRLTEDSPAMLGQFKSMITTEGLSTQTKTGQELSAKFPAWVDQHITGLREALSPAELDSVQRIAQDIQRAMKAGDAGTGGVGTKASQTYQLMANSLNGGLLDSAAAKVVAHKLPYGPVVRSWGAERVGMSRARDAAGFLADSGEAQNMLMQLSQATGESPSVLRRLLENPDLAQLGYRAAPVLGAGR